MNDHKGEALIIGSGPGGYAVAIRLGRFGKKVTIVEKDFVGGTCLNVGCIPSKALIHASKVCQKIRHAEAMGITTGSVAVDMQKMQSWKQGLIEKLGRGVRQLCANAGARFLMGEAVFAGPRQVRVTSPERGEIIEAENIVIATGSHPVEIPGFSFDGEWVLSSKEALELKTIPSRMVVIGAGYIGMELGMLFAKLGTRVSIVEMLDQILPGFEEDVVKVIARQLRRDKIDYYVGARARSWKRGKAGVEVLVETEQDQQVLEGDFILLTVGRRPNTESLQLEKTGLASDEQGFIPVDRRFQTKVPGIYAIGDAAGPPMLAHKSTKEAEIVAEIIAGRSREWDCQGMPAVVFTDPEIATVGLSEKEAKEQGIDVVVGRFPFSASGRAMTTLETEGFVKIVAEKESQRVLGLQIVGAGASDLIGEGTLALEMGACVEDIAWTVHPHPTHSEALMEAAQQLLGEAIHVPH